MLMKPGPHSFIEAFTLIELLIVMVCLGIIAALLLPAMHRAPCCRLNCTNNLKQIGVGFRTWALDNGDKYPPQVSITNGGTMELVGSGIVWPHFSVMSNELSTPKILVCPEDAARERWTAATFGSGGSNCPPFCSDTNVSYFVGVDAVDTSPQMFLTGDANIGLDGVGAKSGLQSFRTNSKVNWFQPRHDKGVNICLADGSVQQVNTRELRKLLMQTGVETNRLAFPAFP
jgi:prepilin-type N-terminal cleavage/methylation domain-containing protein/prepilin-type processing-associated H-X9-DG protein